MFLVFIVLVFCYTPRSLVAVLKEDAFSSVAEVNIITVVIVFSQFIFKPVVILLANW